MRLETLAISKSVLVGLVLALATACAGKPTAVESFSERQQSALRQKSVYYQAEYLFTAGFYEPTLDDLQALRSTWVDYGGAFPESHGFATLEGQVKKTSQKTVLVTLFTTQYEDADLLSKRLGWTVSPVPLQIRELPNDDDVLKRLVPVKNNWARIFMVTYSLDAWSQASALTVSSPQGKIAFGLNGAPDKL